MGYINICKQCGQTFYAPRATDKTCEICAGAAQAAIVTDMFNRVLGHFDRRDEKGGKSA